MRKEYDFADSVKNPHARRLKKQVTLRLNTDTVAFPANESAPVAVGVPVLVFTGLLVVLRA